MKTCVFGIVALLSLSAGAYAQTGTVSLTVDAGVLSYMSGVSTADEPVGGLLELIASPSGTFGAPTTASYVSGDDVLVASFGFNQFAGANQTRNSINNLAVGMGTSFTIGEQLELRFYPTLTFNSTTMAPSLATPTLAANYGQVRSGSAETFPVGSDPASTAFVIPGFGSSVDLDYITVTDGGSYTDASAQASPLDVVLLGVPEPSPSILLAVGLSALLGIGLTRGCTRSAIVDRR